MRKFGIICLAFVAFMLGGTLAASADPQRYLEFDAGQTSPSAQWVGVAPSVGQLPPNAQVLPWAPSNGDLDTSHYQLQNGAVVYAPPAPPVVPDLVSFMAALTADATIPPASHAALATYVGILQAYAANPSALQLEWSRISSTTPDLQLNCTDGTPVVAKVQAYAAQFNVPLVAH